MDTMRMVAKLARIGDLAGIRAALAEEALAASGDARSIHLGFYDADRVAGRDRLPDVPEGQRIKIAPGQPPLPSIYSETPFRGSRERKAA